MRIPAEILAPVINSFYKLWCRTLRVTESGRELVDRFSDDKKLMVFCMWHDEMFPIIHCRRNLQVVAIVSRSRDGEYLARVLQKLGLKTSRGSSSRGGVAAILQTAKVMLEEKYNACITVDGPKGPRHEPKAGALYLAHATPAHVVPLRGFVSRAKVFRSWDRFLLPLPFSRIHVAFGEPYRIEAEKMDDETMALELEVLKKKLDKMKPPAGDFLNG